MLDDDLKNAGEAIQKMLKKPLSIPTSNGAVCLLDAAIDFSSEEALESDLHEIITGMLDSPEMSQYTLQELELIRKDFLY